METVRQIQYSLLFAFKTLFCSFCVSLEHRQEPENLRANLGVM